MYLAHGLFSEQSLLFDAVMIAPTLAGAMVGRKIILLIPERTFLVVVIVLAFAATVLLFLPSSR